MTARLRAHSVLHDIGVPAGAQVVDRAPSLANEVWINGEVVLRVNPVPGSRRLHHEVFVAEQLAPEIGYPPILGHGAARAGEWLLLERVPGVVLSRAWPDMPTRARREAIHDLGARLRAIHQTPAEVCFGADWVPPFLDHDRLESPHHPTAASLRRLTIDLRTFGAVDDSLLDGAAGLIDRLGEHLDAEDTWQLVHGDLHFENVMYHQGHITAVLDFEFCRPGPRDLDLAMLLRFCAEPQLHIAADYGTSLRTDDFRLVPRWLEAEYPELFSAPQLRDRLTLYNLGFDLWELLRHPPLHGLANLVPQHPYHRVRRAVEGQDQLRVLDF